MESINRHVVSRAQERRGDGEQTERSRGLRARKSRKKQHDLTGGFHGRKNTNRSRGRYVTIQSRWCKKIVNDGNLETDEETVPRVVRIAMTRRVLPNVIMLQTC